MKNSLCEPTQYFTTRAKAIKPTVLIVAHHLASHNTVQAQVRENSEYLGFRPRQNRFFLHSASCSVLGSNLA